MHVRSLHVGLVRGRDQPLRENSGEESWTWIQIFSSICSGIKMNCAYLRKRTIEKTQIAATVGRTMRWGMRELDEMAIQFGHDNLSLINANVYHSACILISHLFFTPAQSLALQVVLGSTSMSSISGWPAGRTLYGLGSMSKSLPHSVPGLH